jgi:hypothetical protein
MRNIIKKKKCLLFKHVKNNQTLSNNWPTYCHTGVYISQKMKEFGGLEKGECWWFLLNSLKLSIKNNYLMQTLDLLTHTTYYHIFVKQLMTDFCLFQSHLLSQNGNNTVLLMLFVIMTVISNYLKEISFEILQTKQLHRKS